MEEIYNPELQNKVARRKKLLIVSFIAVSLLFALMVLLYINGKALLNTT